MPSFAMHQRTYVGGDWQIQALPDYPIYQSLEKFLALRVKDLGTGGPFYPP